MNDSAVDKRFASEERSIERAADARFRPLLYRMHDPDDVSALESLVASGEVLFRHDTIESQLTELVETRSPDRKLSRDDVVAQIAATTRGAPAAYGTWVYYPWSHRLVHVLPEAEYEEIRTSRNRNKITRQEQQRLSGVRVGIAGLSVGQSTAVTLALEGIGGLFRLADFDTLSLSNMNRLRAGVHEIGVNKAVLVAREIHEINPYARVELFEHGIRDETMNAFFSEAEPLDVLFEECDDLKMKFRLREEARRRRIPVLMETSDRGLLDVERFDLEPRRPLFHALVAELDPDKLAGMSTYDKVPIVLDIIGAKTMSRRMAASLIDIDATLKTWPQLASAVALGGALNADAARRMILGTFSDSGRFFVDIEAIVSGSGTIASAARTPEPRVEERSSRCAELAPRQASDGPPRGRFGDTTLERLVHLASLAPSGGNCQPWRFTSSAGILRCWHDPARSRSFLDFQHRATHLAFGALAENLRLGAAALGIEIQLTAFPDESRLELVCQASFGAGQGRMNDEDAAVARCIELRTTNRRLGTRSPIPASEARALGETATRAGARLRVVTSPIILDALGELLGAGDRFRFLSRTLHREMMAEIRWTPEEAAARRDGLDLETLELTPTDRAAMRLVSDWSVMAAVREVRGGHGLATSARKSVAAASAIGLLTIPRRARDDLDRARLYFEGGAALERVWLLATSLGLAFQPMTALTYLFARLDEGCREGLDDAECEELSRLRERSRALFELRQPETELMLFRLSRAAPPTARSQRRRVSDMLSFESPGSP